MVDWYQISKGVTHGLSFETRSSNAPQDKDKTFISMTYLML